MLIKEWEIWETFASYFIDSIDDLEKAAKNLVQSGLLECAFVDNGNYYWLKDSKISTGHAEIILGANRSSAFIKTDSALPDGYAGEVILDSAYMRFAELKQFNRAANFPPKYIRGYLGKCILISKKYEYIVYPMIKIYSTGVVLVEIRIISPNTAISLNRFVEEYINLYKRSFDNALIPPGLRIGAQHAFFLSEESKPSLLLPLQKRFFSYWMDSDMQRKIDKNKVSQKDGDFEFQYVNLWDLDILQKEKEDGSKNTDPNFNIYTISDFAKDIFHAVSVAIPGLRRGKSLLLKPNTPLSVGSTWLGRPHIHLLKFQGQTPTARQNETKFHNQFGWMMGGAYEKNSRLGKQFLPKNSRVFNDYGAYIAEQGTLWAWSTKAISDKESRKIPNNGGFVYFNQSICETLEYGHMLHRRIFELVGNLDNPDIALKAREDLVELEAAMREVSGYLEIRDLLFQGWNAMGVNRLKTEISDLIDIRHTESSIREARSLSALQTILAVIFGIVAIPGFATGVIKPFWNWLNFWKPDNLDAAELWFVLIAFILIGLFILFLIRLIRKNHS